MLPSMSTASTVSQYPQPDKRRLFLGLWLALIGLYSLGLILNNAYALEPLTLDDKINYNQRATDENFGYIKKQSETLTEYQRTIDRNKFQLKTLDERLAVIEKIVKKSEATTAKDLDQHLSNENLVAELRTNLKQLTKQMNIHSIGINDTKTSLEKGSIQLYKNLLAQHNNTEQLDQIRTLTIQFEQIIKAFTIRLDTLETQLAISRSTQTDQNLLKNLWLLFATLLSFLLPLGFTLFESSQLEPKYHSSVASRNLLLCLVIFFVYITIGFGIMYGTSLSGWIGVTSPIISIDNFEQNDSLNIHDMNTLPGFIAYQTLLVIGVGLIIANILSIRLSLPAYVCLAIYISALVYPLFGHWVWNGQGIADTQGWLEARGYQDAAGATVLHGLAAWFACIVVWRLQTRQSTSSNQPLATPEFISYNPISLYMVIAVFLFWIGWIGVSLGGQVTTITQATQILLNTSLGGVSSGFASLIIHLIARHKNLATMHIPGSILGGFIAIAAVGHQVHPVEAICIGIIAGMIYHLAYYLLRYTIMKAPELSTAANLVAIHGFCSAWGAISVALFATPGLLISPDIQQLFIQLEGIITVLIFSGLCALLFLLVYLNVTPKQHTRLSL